MTDGDDPTAAVDPARFRQVLGHFPTGVTVVTTMDGQQPAGMAVGSFCSLSLEPPQVLFCAGRESKTLEKVRSAGRFCVNVLGEEQEEVCRRFASKEADKFAGLGWSPSGNGCPRLHGVLSYIDCRVSDLLASGDHEIVVGDVDDLAVLDEGGPLLFFRGGYGRFAP